MVNKLKVAAVVVVAIAGIVLYKTYFDKKEKSKKEESDAKATSTSKTNKRNSN